MTPPSRDSVSWDKAAKIAIGAVGGILAIVIGIAVRAVERQTTAFDELKTAVYAGKTDNAVLSNRVTNVEKSTEETKAKITAIESRLNKDYRP